MAAPLNTFKSYTANLTTISTSIYTAPSGYTTVMLSAQISNISGNTITVSGYHIRSGNPTALIIGASVPVNDALNLLTGKVILQTGDSLYANASANTAAQILVSVLETSNG
jgi:hypothetical protein